MLQEGVREGVFGYLQSVLPCAKAVWDAWRREKSTKRAVEDLMAVDFELLEGSGG